MTRINFEKWRNGRKELFSFTNTKDKILIKKINSDLFESTLYHKDRVIKRDLTLIELKSLFMGE